MRAGKSSLATVGVQMLLLFWSGCGRPESADQPAGGVALFHAIARVSSDVDRSVPITYSLRIAVERWTAAATRERLESSLESGGPERLGRALREAPGIGSIGFRGEAAGVVRSARLTGAADQRRIELVVEGLLVRPMESLPVASETEFTLIVLEIGALGRGTGELVVGSLPTIDAVSGELSFAESSDPVPLVDAIELDG